MAKQAAKARLLAMCEPAFGVLEELMSDPGVADEVKLKAAIAVLDRAGFGPKAQLTLRDKRESLDEKDQDALFERGRRILALLEERRSQVVEDAIEADVIAQSTP